MCTTIEVIFDNVIVQSPSRDTSTIDLVEDVNYTFSNPFNLPIIPAHVFIYKPITDLENPGQMIESPYISINQTTGDITINVGTSYTNAIIKTIGW